MFSFKWDSAFQCNSTNSSLSNVFLLFLVLFATCLALSLIGYPFFLATFFLTGFFNGLGFSNQSGTTPSFFVTSSWNAIVSSKFASWISSITETIVLHFCIDISSSSASSSNVTCSFMIHLITIKSVSQSIIFITLLSMASLCTSIRSTSSSGFKKRSFTIFILILFSTFFANSSDICEFSTTAFI